MESFLIDSLDSYHPGRIHSFNKMCHTDVVTGGSAGRMDGRRNKEILSVQVLTPTQPFSPRVVLAVFIVPSQSTQVYLERELDTFTVHHHNWNTGLSRVRLDNRTEHKLGMHTKHV